MKIFQKVLGINGEAVAKGSGFGRLDVGVGHGGQCGRFFNAIGQMGKQTFELIAQQNGRFPQAQHIHVVRNIGAGGSPMDNATANLALLGKGTDFGHHIVARLFFNFQGTINVDLVGVSLQIGQLRCADQASLLLRRR